MSKQASLLESLCSKKLRYKHLINLLETDKHIRSLIVDIVNNEKNTQRDFDETDQNKNYMEELEQLKQDKKQVQRDLENVRSSHKKLEQELDQSKQEKKQAENGLETLKSSYDALKKGLTQSTQDKERVQEELKDLKISYSELESELEKLKPAQELHNELAVTTKVLALIQKDNDLSKLFLFNSDEDNLANQLLRMVSVGANQENGLFALWRELLDRCKKDEREITEDERTILQEIVRIHNLQRRSEEQYWHLHYATASEKYDMDCQQRLGAKGDIIVQTLLPGLKKENEEHCTGECKPLVKTQ